MSREFAFSNYFVSKTFDYLQLKNMKLTTAARGEVSSFSLLHLDTSAELMPGGEAMETTFNQNNLILSTSASPQDNLETFPCRSPVKLLFKFNIHYS